MSTITDETTSALVLPRGLIFLAALWLVGSWLLTLGATPPVQPSSASYEPGLRVMLQSVVIGLGIGWPLLRLSQKPPTKPLGQTVLDLLVLLTLLQVVIWLPRLLTNWPASRAGAIDLSVMSWTVLIGAIVAAGMSSLRDGPRTFAMLGCVAICLAGPLVTWLGWVLGFEIGSAGQLGPLMAVRELTAGGATKPSTTQWMSILVVAIAAIAAWVALIAILLGREKMRDRAETNNG